MDTIVKFNARGTTFMLPKSKLEKVRGSLLNLLSTSSSIPVDKVAGDAIYIDIMPSSIGHIIDYYNSIGQIPDNYYVLMDFRYIGICVNSDTEKLPFGYHISDNMCSTTDIDISTIELSKYKYCKIHTADDKNIIISVESYSGNNLNKLNNMFTIIDKFDGQYVDVYTCFPEKIMNIVLSVMRDGIDSYNEYLTDNTFERVMQNYMVDDMIDNNIGNYISMFPFDKNILKFPSFPGIPGPKFPQSIYSYPEYPHNRLSDHSKIARLVKNNFDREKVKKEFEEKRRVIEYLKLCDLFNSCTRR